MYVVKNENGLYYKKGRTSYSPNVNSPDNWTDDINKARVFRSSGDCKNSDLGESVKDPVWEEYESIPYQARKMLGHVEMPPRPRERRRMKPGFTIIKIELTEVEVKE